METHSVNYRRCNVYKELQNAKYPKQRQKKIQNYAMGTTVQDKKYQKNNIPKR